MRPARRAITFSSRSPACVKRWRSIWSGWKPLRANSRATSSAVAASPGVPARRSGCSVAIRSASRAAFVAVEEDVRSQSLLQWRRPGLK